MEGRGIGAVVLLALALAASVLLAAGPVWAAEVLQVRSATLLQIGDGNRSFPVELACVAVSAEQQQPGLTWLRQQLPRRSRVNLRPLDSRDGVMLARVRRLDADTDLASGLIASGHATAEPC